jgi:hypothetical protein
MTGSFKIDLKNKNTGDIVKTVTVPAVITDYWKYESTHGYPFVYRGAGGTWPNGSPFTHLLTAPFSTAGIQLFENTLSTKRDKFRTKLSDTYIAYASRYNATGNPEQYSSKAGHMSDYQLTSDFTPNSQIGGQVTHTLKWSWDADHGNGTFNSLGTLNAQGAHAKDIEPILSSGVESINTINAGQDFSLDVSENYFSYNGPPYPREINVNAANSGTMQDGASVMTYISEYIHSQGSASEPIVYYYQTSSNIVQLWFNKKNELQQDNTYLSEIRYRVIQKTALHRFYFGQMNGLHPLNINYDNYDGSFNINTGTHQLISPDFSENLSGLPPIKIEKSAYFACFVKDSDTANGNPNPDRKTPLRYQNCPLYKVKTYVIYGTTPQLISFSSTYDSVLSIIAANSYSAQAYSNVLSCTGILFTQDFAYIYADVQNQKVVKRYLSGDIFSWDMRMSGANRILLTFLDNEVNAFGMCKYYQNVLNFSALTTIQYTVLNINDPTDILGYCLKLSGNSKPINEDFIYNMIQIWDYRVDNPFILYAYNKKTGLPDSNCFAICCKSDALFAKANLPEPITKTSDYTLDITLTLNIY